MVTQAASGLDGGEWTRLLNLGSFPPSRQKDLIEV